MTGWEVDFFLLLPTDHLMDVATFLWYLMGGQSFTIFNCFFGGAWQNNKLQKGIKKNSLSSSTK
jgi:hypothetical protein